MTNLRAALGRLSLHEKASLVTGASFWTTAAATGVPSFVLTDGPHGVRKLAKDAKDTEILHSEPATAFPAECATGSSWDPGLIAEIGTALGIESRARGVDVLLGPGVNIKRSPLGGRNFEYFSEDPVLAGRLGAAWVQAVQQTGIGASVKHFAANNQETARMVVSAEVDERTLREIYFPAFEHVVREAKPATVMCAYNGINGVPAAHNRWLLTEVLRDDWGFEGFVVSDWGAVSDVVASVAAGLDLEMPATAGASAAKIVAAVESGRLEVAALNRAVERILGVFEDLLARRGETAPPDLDAHHALVRRAAAASAVLLTNSGGILPLSPETGGKLAVIGEFARTPRFQGGGSSHVTPTRIENALDEITALVAGRREVVFAPGFSLAGEAFVAEAVEAARDAAEVVLFLGVPEDEESEGFDRRHLDLPAAQLEVLRAVAEVNPRVVVVLSNGGVVTTGDVEQYAPAVLEMWLGGQASGGAAADVLFGVADPGGRLAETIPLTLADNPSYVNFPGTPTKVLYGERIYVGYRWYDKVGREVRHPFGHGLSYTTFAYSDLDLRVPDPERNEATVAFTVTNTGDRAGNEVAQVYVSDTESSADRPVRELKAFRKLHLSPGESERVELTLTERDFAFWDSEGRRWLVEPGQFVISVGSSSRALKLSGSIELTVEPELPPLHLDAPVADWLARPHARDALIEVLANAGSSPDRPDFDPALLRMIDSMPLRRMLTFGGGSVPDEEVEALLRKVNS